MIMGTYIQEAVTKYFKAAHNFANAAEPRGLDAAVKSGLLTVAGWTDDQPASYEGEQEYVNRAGDFILDLVGRNAGTLALDVGALTTLQLEGERVSSRDEILSRALLESLPTFSNASLDELLDVRSSLAAPLTRFRSAVTGIAAGLPPVDDLNFISAVQTVYRTRVAPALAEIDELSREDSYLLHLRDAAVDVKAWVPAAGSFAVGVAAFSGVLTLLTAAAGVASLPLTAAAKTLVASRTRAKSEFFFLWSVGRPCQRWPRGRRS